MSEPPSAEFQFPLSWTGPDGIGASPFDEFAEAEAVDIEGDDPAVALRKTLGMFATGVTVITTLKGEQVHGMTANAFMSVSLEPPLVLISVDRDTKMCGMLHEGSHYGVSVLCESQAKLSDRFAGRPCDDCPNPQFNLVRETPLVDGALAHFVARVRSRTGAATTPSSWAGSSTPARARAPRCCSTAGATAAGPGRLARLTAGKRAQSPPRLRRHPSLPERPAHAGRTPPPPPPLRGAPTRRR